MSLLTQVAGVLAGMALTWALARGRLGARALPVAALTVAAGLVATATAVTAWPAVKGLADDRARFDGLPRRQAETAGARSEGHRVNVEFWEWAARELPPRASFFPVLPRGRRDTVAYQWGTYRLLPRLATDRISRADWLVFYGIPPSAAGYRYRDFAAVRTYGRAFVLARRHRAR
jgi:hypothetical protein